MNCEAIQERLDDLALAHALESADAALAEHVRECADCRAHRSFLLALSGSLAGSQLEPVTTSVLALAEQRALRVLRARQTPSGVGRELAAALALALLALPLVVAHAYLVIEGGAWLLGAWVPAPLLGWLGAVYLLSLALGVGALYGLIPLAVAWRKRASFDSASVAWRR